MGKGKAKGKDGKVNVDEKKSDVLDGAFADKKYKQGIQNLIRNTPVQPSDFDSKAILLLDALQEKGRALEACQHLQNSLQGVSSRRRISNPRAYVYTLLRGFDESAYLAMKAESGSENRRRRRHQRAEKDGSDEEDKSADKDKTSAPLPVGTPVGLSLAKVLEQGKKFNEGAAEFVPGQLWSNPAAGVPQRPLRYEAVEFVPHQPVLPSAGNLAASSSAAATTAMKPTANEFQPSLKESAAEFRPGHSAWSGAAEATEKSLKKDAVEFFPGVSAWAGAVTPSKAPKAKAKAKAPKAGPATPSKSVKSPPSSPQPEKPGPVARALAPGAINLTEEADTAAGVPASNASKATAVDFVSSPTKRPTSEALNVVGAISDTCRKALSTQAVPRQLSKSAPWPVALAGKQVSALTEVFSVSECTSLMHAAEQCGFCPAEQDRAGGSLCKLSSHDPWLSAELWQRVKGHMPLVFRGRPVLGLEDQIDFTYGSLRQTLIDEAPGTLALQACLSPGEGAPRQGDLLVFQTAEVGSDSGKRAAWLRVQAKCGGASFFSRVQSALGFGGPRSECRKRAMATTAMLLISASLAVPLLKRRR
eukprot:TRINITY_DN40_c0_g1_i1.p1 TRINITY_DN40_c0_g1~~TRINITY_DN40_c0_g1_i1.p1  ORF type:complete len:616 (-),score=126.99 TRINITY_DN40_c0_g1_i1:40-1806(-)